MIYPDVKLKDWIKRYSLNTKPIECPNCGTLQELTIPIAMHNARGLQAPEHSCGKEFQAIRYIYLDEALVEAVAGLFN